MNKNNKNTEPNEDNDSEMKIYKENETYYMISFSTYDKNNVSQGVVDRCRYYRISNETLDGVKMWMNWFDKWSTVGKMVKEKNDGHNLVEEFMVIPHKQEDLIEHCYGEFYVRTHRTFLEGIWMGQEHQYPLCPPSYLLKMIESDPNNFLNKISG